MQPSTVARPGSRHPAYQAFPALLPCLAAAGVVLLSLAVLFGWWQEVTWLQRASPDFAPTLPGTAFSLLLAGASLALSGGRRRWQAWPARLLAGGVLYAGLEALYEALSGQGLLLHPLLLAALRETQAYPMSEVAGLSLLLAGLCLLLSQSGAAPLRRLVVQLATAGLLLALVSFIGYLYGSGALLGEGVLQPVSLHASLAFLLLFGGLLLLNARWGWPGILAGERPAASSARSLLGVLILVSLGVAWMAEYGELQGWYDKEFRLALLTLLTLLLLTVLVLHYSRRTAQLYEVQLDAAEALRAGEARFRQAADEANRRKDEFLATLGHELRNPLAPIHSSAQLLKRLTAGDPAAQELSEILERQVRHMTRLVDDLLDVSRITLGRISLRRSRLSLCEVVRGAVSASRYQLEHAGLSLCMELPEEVVEVDGDATRLTQVVLNLLNNAMKFTPRGGEVRISAGASGDAAWIAVQDTGVGIDAASLQEIFEMFRQVGARDQRQGLGIGLALARSIVELHGGRIEVASEGEGRGSEFRVLLPRLPARLAPAESDHPPASLEAACAPMQDLLPTRAQAPSTRVLLVDDNEDALLLLAMHLRLCGFEVETAADGRGALARAAVFRPDAVVLDIGLPDMDGHAVARALRADPQHAGLLLVALTGWGQAADKRLARESGFDRHFTKPADSALLLDLLRRAGRSGCAAEPARLQGPAEDELAVESSAP